MEEKIKNALMQKGVPEKLIDQHFADVVGLFNMRLDIKKCTFDEAVEYVKKLLERVE